MVKRQAYIVATIVIILVLALAAGLSTRNQSATPSTDVFVGVDAAYTGVENIEELVNQIKDYTNFFVIGSTGITNDLTSLNAVCQYINDSGLYFEPFMHINPSGFNQTQWVEQARQTWSNRFLGLFVYDEPGGAQIDNARSTVEEGNLSFMLAPTADNYSDAANKFTSNLQLVLSPFRFGNFPLMTSDYALYEFDYTGGYNVVLAEFGYNLSKPLQVALCRGAATMHNEDWGVIITWTYSQWPYLENGTQLYNDMVYAYNCGAKYILVFDYPGNFTYGILQLEHFDALKQFWQYIHDNPRTSTADSDRIAYVLPTDYGYGLRGPSDTIWGLWPADNLSSRILNETMALLGQYGSRLDIIFNDSLQFGTFKYSKLIFWNETS